MLKPLRVGLVQMQSLNNLDKNLEAMEHFLAAAQKVKADVVAFPEMAYFAGRQEEWKPLLARYTEITDKFSEWARKYRVMLVPGSIREPVKTDEGKYFNTSLFFVNTGQLVGKYRKIFLFKGQLPDRSYDEAKHCIAGNAICTFDDHGWTFGAAICFDLRFPELFRALKRRGTQVAFLPSAFTVPTGTYHWKTLVRSRAIENQMFVIAPGQVGELGDGNKTYGHSMAVSPWGEVVCEIDGDKAEIQFFEIDEDGLQKAKASIDAWESRREDVFPIA